MAEKWDFNFLAVISFIGAVLILVGISWMIGSNWHQIPGPIKIFILVVATLAAIISGEIVKNRGHEFTGRSLLFLGGGLYVLSVFLISQILMSNVSDQMYANLFLICWPVLFLIAYFLDSKENIISGFVVFGIWVINQYILIAGDRENVVLTIILLTIMIGSILFVLKGLHKVYKHKFYGIYSFWTAVYILLGAFILTFQDVAGRLVLSDGAISFSNPFFLFMSLFSVVFFIVGIFFILSKDKKEKKEILIFIGIIIILLFTIFLFKTSALAGVDDSNGYCNQIYDDTCFRVSEQEECVSEPSCEWKEMGGSCLRNYSAEARTLCGTVKGIEFCYEIKCHDPKLRTEGNCSKVVEYGCYWQENANCRLKDEKTGVSIVEEEALLDRGNCYQLDSKDNCDSRTDCEWRTNYGDINLNWVSYAIWWLYNLFFIGLIIVVIGYGKEENQRRIVDLAFLFFVIEIISRYIGFMMDLDGYLAFSIGSIIGGIILIFGSYFIKKYWEQQVKEIKK